MEENFADKYRRLLAENPALIPLNQLIHHARQGVIANSRGTGEWQLQSIETAKQKVSTLLSLVTDEQVLIWLRQLFEIFSRIDTSQAVNENDSIFDKINHLVSLIEERMDQQFHQE